MKTVDIIPLLGNSLAIVGLAAYGFRLLARYYSTGQWAKNVTSLLAGIGLLTLSLSLVLTAQNVRMLEYLAHSNASVVLLWTSSLLLLGAMTAFGVITYRRTLRLWHEPEVP